VKYVNVLKAVLTGLAAALTIDPKLSAEFKKMGHGFSLHSGSLHSGSRTTGRGGWRRDKGICAKVRRGRVQARARRRAKR